MDRSPGSGGDDDSREGDPGVTLSTTMTITLTPNALSRLDMSRHMLVVGRTGGGKSTMLRMLLERELGAGGGALLLDPHGDLAREVAAQIPRRRKNDVTFFDLSDNACPGLNPFARLRVEDRSLAVSNLLAAFKIHDSCSPIES